VESRWQVEQPQLAIGAPLMIASGTIAQTAADMIPRRTNRLIELGAMASIPSAANGSSGRFSCHYQVQPARFRTRCVTKMIQHRTFFGLDGSILNADFYVANQLPVRSEFAAVFDTNRRSGYVSWGTRQLLFGLWESFTAA
jgi:hypothetical protein